MARTAATTTTVTPLHSQALSYQGVMETSSITHAETVPRGRVADKRKHTMEIVPHPMLTMALKRLATINVSHM